MTIDNRCNNLEMLSNFLIFLQLLFFFFFSVQRINNFMLTYRIFGSEILRQLSIQRQISDGDILN